MASPAWTVSPDGKSLQRRFAFADFDAAFALVARVAAVAREADHHPDVAFGWGYAAFTLTTHASGGLTDRDEDLACRIDVAADIA